MVCDYPEILSIFLLGQCVKNHDVLYELMKTLKEFSEIVVNYAFQLTSSETLMTLIIALFSLFSYSRLEIDVDPHFLPGNVAESSVETVTLSPIIANVCPTDIPNISHTLTSRLPHGQAQDSACIADCGVGDAFLTRPPMGFPFRGTPHVRLEKVALGMGNCPQKFLVV